VPEIELLAPNFQYDPIRATQALSIGQWLDEAGIAVTVILTDSGSIVQRVFGDVDFDTYIFGWSLGNIAFPDYFESFWHSRNDTATTGHNNTPGYNNPVYDAICDDFMTTSDLQQARDDAFQMQDILATELPYLTLHTTQVFDAYYHEWISFPYTETLDGLEGAGGMPALVQFLVASTTVEPSGGTLEVPLADTAFAFPAGTFSETVVVSYTVQQPSTTGELVGAGSFFDLSAIYSATGQPAEVEPGHSYTVEIHYGNIGSTIEDTLGLYWWDESTSTWSQEGIVNAVDTQANVVTAQVDHFSLFALLGETNRVYLPLLLKND
jgi:hypothetical protein